MNTCRRTLLDMELTKNVSLMHGRVLDVGGVRVKRRGDFVLPSENIKSWQYVNINPVFAPDFCCDASSIPVSDGSFDTVLMTELLEYVARPPAVVSEAFRVLAAGGCCLLSVPFMHPVHGDRAVDRQRFTAVFLQEMCSSAGFELVDTVAMGSLFSVVYDFLHVCLSYTRANPQRFYLKILRRFLWLFKPACLLFDGFLRNLGAYINTGYFVVLRKPDGQD